MPDPKKPGPKGTYVPLGNGMYEIRTGGRNLRMRIDPAKLDAAGYVRTVEGSLPYMSAQDMLNKRLQRTEMMSGPKTSRQYVADWWESMQPELNMPRQGTTTVQPAKEARAEMPKPPPAPEKLNEYELTERGIEPSERGMWEVSPREQQLREEDLKAMQDYNDLVQRYRQALPRGKYM